MNRLPMLGTHLLRALVPRLDLPLLAGLLLLSAAGLLTLHSATHGNPQLFMAQALRFGVGFAALWAIALVPPQQLRLWTPWLFALSLVLLLLVPVMGTGRSGRHWLNLGVFYLQPAELVKLTFRWPWRRCCTARPCRRAGSPCCCVHRSSRCRRD